MPPTSVLISTCLSSPFCSFFTFTLQPEARMSAATNRQRKSVAGILFLYMMRTPVGTCAGDLRGTLDARSARRYVRDGHRKMTADRDLSEQSFDCGDLRYRGVRK